MNQPTALITGASSGIGLELAKIHAAKGGDLVIVARRKEQLDRLKKELVQQYKINVLVLVKDLAETGAAQEIYNEVHAAGIKIDYLINNAGFGGRGYFHERSLTAETQMIQVNVLSLMTLTHLFLSDFMQANRGKILNVSSTASFMPGPLQATYYATKSFVTSFSNALTEEVRDKNITISTLLPGGTETEFAKTADLTNTPLFAKTVSPKIVAEKGYQGMLDGKLNIIAGLSPIATASLRFIPLLPKRVMLKQIFTMQQKN